MDKEKELTMEELKATIAEGIKESVGTEMETLKGEISILKSRTTNPLIERAEKSAEFIKAMMTNDKKALTSDVSSFGYAIPTQLADAIAEKKAPIAQIRKHAFVFSMAGNFQLPREGTGVTAYWVTTEEDADITESNLSLTKVELVDNWLAVRVRIPMGLLNSSPINIENYVANLASRAITVAEEVAFMAGDGNGKPTGIRQASVGTVDQAGADLSYDDLVNLFYELPMQYRVGNDVAFLTSTNGMKLIRKLKDLQGLPIFNPADGTVFGKPLLECSDIPENLGTTTNETEIWVGDLKEYWIKDGANMVSEVRPVQGRLQTDFYLYEAVDGVVVNTDAFKKLTDVK